MAGEYVATSVDHPERTQVISYVVHPVVDREVVAAMLRRIAELEQANGFLGDQLSGQIDYVTSTASQIRRCAVALLVLQRQHPELADEIEEARRQIWPGVCDVG